MKKVFSIIASIWILRVFLTSIPYKLTGHEETQNIFGPIWDWMKWIFGESIGAGFSAYGPYIIGAGEVVISIILLIPIVFYIGKAIWFMKSKDTPEYLFAIGGLGSAAMMTWAVFFHLGTPLGIEVNGDGGSLFKAAVSILILWVILAGVHGKSVFDIAQKLIVIKK